MIKFDENCIHCYVYHTDRKSIIDKNKNKFKNINHMYPINFNCPSKNCMTNTFPILEVKNEEMADDESSEDEKFTSDDENINWDNWDLEPNFKIHKNNNENNELDNLLKNLKLCNKKNTCGKKSIPKKYKQLKITSFDISYLLNKINLN
uniref:Uncharacterized protein n=1 Tax=Mimiviridae sp. ChoanoV1 TaxID=2596887 RepID=A0A5B8IPM4_9VIRU|nr:hypothetical protein 3_70 [Mimiviridae sp. ChoanoV1]